MIEIALYQPEIPPNTGNIGRLCVGYAVRLGLIGPLGFSLDEKALRRAGLDYWPKLEVEVFEDFASFWEARVVQVDVRGEPMAVRQAASVDTVPSHSKATNVQSKKAPLSDETAASHGKAISSGSPAMSQERRRVICLSKHGKDLLHDWTFRSGDIVLLGNETRGIPFTLSEEYDLERIAIPMSKDIRSYNLANAAAMALGEAYRQLRWTL